jgi:hypothetical protein
MEALRETTGGLFPAHTYLLDGTTLVAYIKRGETTPFYFSKGIKGFDKRGRKFEKADAKLFKVQPKSDLIAVEGSKGKTYYVDPEAKTCTCPGFTFRGACKHVVDILGE